MKMSQVTVHMSGQKTRGSKAKPQDEEDATAMRYSQRKERAKEPIEGEEGERQKAQTASCETTFSTSWGSVVSNDHQ